MLFHSVTIPDSAISHFYKRDQFNVVREVKMDWDRFISVVVYSSSMFSETFPLGASMSFEGRVASFLKIACN